MLNPFDLRGPEFLLFYACLGMCVLAVLYYLQRRHEDGPRPRIDTSDPYLIAYLRGGRNEAARVATVSLIDRGLIEDSGTDHLAARDSQAEVVRRPLEKAIMGLFSHSQHADAIFKAPSVTIACREYETNLARLGLLPDEAARAQRRALLLGAILVLLGIAGVKIFVALGRGHTNIVFLVILAGVFTVVCVKLGNRWRTRRGDAMLEDLRRLFTRLEARAPAVRSGGASAEAAFIAAVFGISALPTPAFAYAHRLFRKAAKGAGGRSKGSSCGSACGSSSGWSCGGGSSGGDSGGGGGGCGGCGGGG